jgi:hypothetical protein
MNHEKNPVKGHPSEATYRLNLDSIPQDAPKSIPFQDAVSIYAR